MTRESRLILTPVLIAVIGVSGLTLVANQYRKALAAKPVAGGSVSEDASHRAARLADGFLAARRAAKTVTSRYTDTIERTIANADATRSYRIERFNAFTAHGMTYEDYTAVRAAWRAHRAGLPVGDPPLVAAFKARRMALDDAALGPFEALDDAIK